MADDSEQSTRAAETEADEAVTRSTDADDAETPPEQAELRRRKRWPTAVGAAGIALICALLGASGYIAWHHHREAQYRQHLAAFTAAAKQGVINMMSLDFQHAQDDIQRVLDNATGEFKDDFERQADQFITVTKDSQVISKGAVNLAAVESMDADSAVVLVSATSHVTNSAGAKEEPRVWRLRVTVVEDGDQIKMSKLMYVP